MTTVTIDAPEYQYYDLVIKSGATAPNLEAQLETDAGDPVDITGSTVRFRMKKPGGDQLKIDEPATITNAGEGLVVYQWNDGDTDTVETYNAEFAVDNEGNTGSNFDPDEYFPSDEYLNINVMESL